jgi:hypothetical protein
MYTAMEEFRQTIQAAKAVSTPILLIRSADPNATLHMFAQGLFDPSDVRFQNPFPMVMWDMVDGFKPLNELGMPVAQSLGVQNGSSYGPLEPRPALVKLNDLPEGGIAFFLNAHRYLEQSDVVQAVYNLRDRFTAKCRTLVLLAQPGSPVPGELTDHVLVLDEPLPTHDVLKQVVEEVILETQQQWDDMEPIPPAHIEQATDALMGVTVFAAQQTIAMCLSPNGLNLERVWNQKVQIIQQTPGLSVWKGGERFSDIAGVENVKNYLRLILNSQNAPGAIVFIDEIEKHLAGHGTDLSGVKTEMVGCLLTWMQDKAAQGLIFIGPSGTAKSVTAKSTGNESGIPTISLDFSGMQSSHVGASGKNLRGALNVIDAVSQSRPLFIATSNNVNSLPPELLRRFTKGTFFFDLPDENARAPIWELYCSRFGLTGQRPNDQHWAGSDIRTCCENARDLRIPLTRAAEYIVPVGISSRDHVRQLRLQASGRYTSASTPGPYVFNDTENPLPGSATRSMKRMGAVGK